MKRISLHILENALEIRRALASMAQLVGASSHNQNVVGLIPGQGTCLGCGSIPSPVRYNTLFGYVGSNQSMFLSLSLPFSKSNEKMSSGKDTKKYIYQKGFLLKIMEWTHTFSFYKATKWQHRKFILKT